MCLYLFQKSLNIINIKEILGAVLDRVEKGRYNKGFRAGCLLCLVQNNGVRWYSRKGRGSRGLTFFPVFCLLPTEASLVIFDIHHWLQFQLGFNLFFAYLNNVSAFLMDYLSLIPPSLFFLFVFEFRDAPCSPAEVSWHFCWTSHTLGCTVLELGRGGPWILTRFAGLLPSRALFYGAPVKVLKETHFVLSSLGKRA